MSRRVQFSEDNIEVENSIDTFHKPKQGLLKNAAKKQDGTQMDVIREEDPAALKPRSNSGKDEEMFGERLIRNSHDQIVEERKVAKKVKSRDDIRRKQEKKLKKQ